MWARNWLEVDSARSDSSALSLDPDWAQLVAASTTNPAILPMPINYYSESSSSSDGSVTASFGGYYAGPGNFGFNFGVQIPFGLGLGWLLGGAGSVLGGLLGGIGSLLGGLFGLFGLPVVLDLSGRGIDITQLSSSNTFFDLAGDGYQYRTAWAGAGNAVLAFDANSDGRIDQRNEIVFTEWNPTATSDMQALQDVFDTNHDGRLDSGDAQFSQFKLLVTNADGTQTLETLGQAGVASIDLKEDNSSRVFADGSSIDGQTTFTRTDGTTGTAASVTFAAEALGYRLQTTKTIDGAGTVTVDNKSYDPDGRLANETISIVSADGKSKILNRDVDGDGVIDFVQTDVTVVNGDGSSIEALADTTAAGVLLDRTVTTTSADGKGVTIQRDFDGNGIFEQTETLATGADGSKSDTVSNFSRNGSLVDKTSTMTTADGLTRGAWVDRNGDGAWDMISVDATVVDGDGSRTETISDVNADGSLRSRTTVRTSADGLAKTRDVDVDGNGTIDLSQSENIARNADGSYWVTQTDRNGDGTTRDATTVLLSADNLSKTTWVDANGDGAWDLVTTDVTVVGGDGSRTETTTDYNGDGSKRDQTFVTRGADGRSRSIQVDQNGDGAFERVETITVSAGASVDVTSNYNADGSLIDRSAVSSSADGLSKTTQIDSNGDGTYDLTTIAVTTRNGDGSSTVNSAAYAANGAALRYALTTTSADDLTATTKVDVDGNGEFDFTTVRRTTTNAPNQSDGPTNAPHFAGDISQYRIVSDGQTTVVTDGQTAQSFSNVASLVFADGVYAVFDNALAYIASHPDLTTALGANAAAGVQHFLNLGWREGRAVTFDPAIYLGNYADLLAAFGGDGIAAEKHYLEHGAEEGRIWDHLIAGAQPATISNGAGSIAWFERGEETAVSDYNKDGSLRSRSTTWTSFDKQKSAIQTDLNGDGAADQIELIETAADGTTTDTISEFAPNGALRDRTASTVDAAGLSRTTRIDSNGDGVWDTSTTDDTSINSDGTSSHATVEYNANGSIRDKSFVQTSANGLSTAKWIDINGDGAWDSVATATTTPSADGSRAELVTVNNGDGSRRTQTLIQTNATGLTKTIFSDLDGKGGWDRVQTDSTALDADGGTTRTVIDTNANGSLRDKSVTRVSADGRSRTVSSDTNGDGQFDTIETVILASNGDSIDTITDYNPDGSKRDQSVVDAGANGSSKTEQVDLNGDGVFDSTKQSVTTLNADGGSTLTVSDLTANGSLRGRTATQISADGLARTVREDANGDGTYDLTTADLTTLNADGSRTKTEFLSSSNGSLHGKTVTTTSADQRTIAIVRDINGDGVTDQTETVVVQADGGKVDTVSDLNADGSLKGKRITTTGANGLSTTVELDTNGDGAADETLTDVTVFNADGSKTETFTDYDGQISGSIKDQVIAWTSADGLSTTLQRTGANGHESFFENSSDVTILDPDGSRVRTVTELTASGALKSKSVTTTAADGSTNLRHDINGDGTFDVIDGTIVNLDGGRTEALTIHNLDGSLRQSDVLTTSWDGRAQSLERDTNGDGVPDHYETKRVEANGSTTDISWNQKADGSLRDRIVTVTSADGLSKTIRSDTNGDGATDSSQSQQTSLNSDGSRTVTLSNYNSNGTLKDRTVTTTDAFGLSKTVQLDLDGDGTVEESGTDVTILNADGSKTETLDNLYSDGSLKARIVTTTSADGHTIATTIDSNGDGVKNRSHTIVAGADGSKTDTTIFYDASGITTSSVTASISFDGRTTTVKQVGAYNSYKTETTTVAANANGSYTWSQIAPARGGFSDPNNWMDQLQNPYGPTGYAAHTIDANGIDTWVWNETPTIWDWRQVVQTAVLFNFGYNTGTSHSITIDLATEEKLQGVAARLYDAVFDRNMLTSEREYLAKYISNGQLDIAQVVSPLLTSQEFSARYGTLTNIQFVERIYENALGRSASLSELSNYLSQLNAGTITRTDIIAAVSESAEHVAVDNVHAVTNNTALGTSPVTLEHTTDKAVAAEIVTRLYTTALGRDPTTSELSGGVQKIVDGSATEAQIANELLSVTWVLWPYISNPSLFDQTYGSLSNSDFVARLYLNAVGRDPTAQESSTWVAMLDTGAVTRADVLYAIAESPDHLSSVGAQSGQAVDASNQTLYFGADVTANVTGGGNTIYGSGGDILTIGGNGAWGPDNYVNLSNGAANLSDDSRMDVFGSGNAIHVGKSSNVGVNGNSNSLTAGSGDGIWINGGVGNVVNASGDAIFVAANVGVGVIGGGDAIYGQSGSRIDLAGNGPDGSSNAVDVSNGFVNLADYARADVHGSNDTIGLGNNDVLSVAGDGNRITFGAEDTVSAAGNSNMFVFHSNFGHDTINGFNSTDTLRFDQSVFADWAHLLGAAHQSGADTIIAADATNTITLQNVALSSLNQNQFHFS